MKQFMVLSWCIGVHLSSFAQSYQPQLFLPNLVSTPSSERDIAISSTGDTIIFTAGNPDQSKRSLVQITKANNGWSEPQLLPFSGEFQDIEPFFHPNGKQLFFASKRPVEKNGKEKDYDIWVVEVHDSGWSPPKRLPSPINTEKDEYYPSISKNGNLYFTSSREGGYGLEDIWMSANFNGFFSEPVALDSTINTKGYEYNAFISPDENVLIFGAFGRKDGLGKGDLYMSLRDEDGHWQKGVNLGMPINSPSLDYCPFIDYETERFYFTSNRSYPGLEKVTSYEMLKAASARIENGLGNIYWIELDALPPLKSNSQ